MLHILHHANAQNGVLTNDGALYFEVNADGLGGCIVSAKNLGRDSAKYRVHPTQLDEAVPVSVYLNVSNGEFVENNEESPRRDVEAFMRTNDFASLAFSAVAFAGNLYLIFWQDVSVLCKAELHKVEPGKSVLRAVEGVAPEFASHKLVVGRRAKFNVIYNINPLESLSDLEKQVDLLSQLVMDVVGLIPEESRPAIAAKYAPIMGYAATTQKDVDSCVSDVIKQKQHIREKLGQYYSIKDGNA